MNEVVFKKRFNVKKDLFANNEQGLWLDPSDMTREKAAWRRNLLLNTEALSLSPWTADGATFSANTTVAPNGTTTAGTFTGASGNYRIYQQRTSVVGESHTISLYVKQGTSPTVQIDYINVNNGPVFTFATESFSSIGGFTTNVQNVGSGWYRLLVTATNTNSNPGPGFRASGATTFFIWGVQYEQSSTPTDYQPITDFSTEFKQAFPTHTMYQDSSGVTPCTAAGDPVGLILDQSRGGLGAIGSELVTNGGFDSNLTGWTAVGGGTGVASGGVLNFTASAVQTGGQSQDITTSANAVRIAFRARRVSGTSGANIWGIPRTGGFASPNTQIALTNTSSWTNYSFIIFRESAATGIRVYLQVIAGDAVWEFDDVSVREVPGNHAFQTTSASRPTLARIPSSGRRNLLTYSEQFDNAVWTKFQSTISANATTAPDGTSTADSFVDAATTQEHNLYQSQTTTTATFSVYAKANARSTVALRAFSASNEFYTVVFDLQNGVISLDNETGTTFSSTTSSITSVGSGWYRCSISYTRSSGATFHVIDLCNSTTPTLGAGGSQVYLGNGTGIFLWGAQLETGSTATNYQKVVATTDVTESGVSDLWHLVFDGSDDSLVTNAVDFSTWTQETRRNLLVDTEDFSTWTNNGGTVSSNTTEAPDGTMTADTLVRASGVNDGRFRSVTFTGDGAKAVSVYVKAGTAPTLSVWLYDSTAVANRVLADVNMTVSPPTVTLTAGASSSVEDVGNGWFRLKFVSTSVTAANTHSLYLLCARSPSIDGQTSIFWGAQAENSATVTTYQRVGTDEMTVIAGVRQAVTPSAENVIVELSTFYNSNSGTLIVNSNTSPNFGFAARGTSTGFYTPTATLPSTNVLSCNFDISGAALAQQIIPRINGQLSQSGAFGSLGSGNFGNYQLFIGRRNQATLPFNGHIYQLIIRGKTTPTGKLLEAERFVGKKTGVNL